MANDPNVKPPLKKMTPQQKLADATKGMSEYLAEKTRVDNNMLRLRAERLAREASDEAPKTAEKKPSKAKSSKA